MKNTLTKSILLLLLLSNIASAAWVVESNATITGIVEWNSVNSQERVVYFKRSDGNFCYILANEEHFYSLILTLFTTGAKSTIHCYDSITTNVGGIFAYRLHRIAANSPIVQKNSSKNNDIPEPKEN